MVRNQDRLSWTIRCIISKYFENYDFCYWFRILNNAFSLFLTFHLSISTFRMAPTTTRQRWDLWEVLWLNLWCIATPWLERCIHFHQQMSLYKRMNEWKADWAEEEAEGWIFRPTFILLDNICTTHRTPYIISTRQAYPVPPALELYGGKTRGDPCINVISILQCYW